MENQNNQPGLYSPQFEHDNCGIGAVVSIKGVKTHQTVSDALSIVENLEHRAGKDAEGKTGDGVGILLQISHKFFKKAVKPLGIKIGEEREYGVGMFFFPQDELARNRAKKMFEIIVEKEGLEFLGWREVPTFPNVLGKKAVDCMPYIMQGFVKKPKDVNKGIDFDRKLYVARRVFEQTEFRREDIILQSKCGIVPGVMYDFSKEHILQSVEESLRRLRTDYLDILLLHRPDALMEPEEVAEAFDLLEGSGKVRHFGVSNHTPMQIQLLKKCVRQDLLVNQLQFSIPFSNMVASGLEANMLTDGAVNRDNSVLDFCRLHDMTIQAWSPFQYGFFEGVFVDSEKYPELNQVLADLAEKYGTTKTGIASAWIFRHPAKIQMVAGTTNLKRLREIALAADIRLTREEWYQLYLSAGHILP